LRVGVGVGVRPPCTVVGYSGGWGWRTSWLPVCAHACTPVPLRASSAQKRKRARGGPSKRCCRRPRGGSLWSGPAHRGRAAAPPSHVNADGGVAVAQAHALECAPALHHAPVPGPPVLLGVPEAWPAHLRLPAIKPCLGRRCCWVHSHPPCPSERGHHVCAHLASPTSKP